MTEKGLQFDYVVPDLTRDYWIFVMVTLAEVPAGMYGLDQRRAELHSALCEHYGLTREQTKTVTGSHGQDRARGRWAT